MAQLNTASTPQSNLEGTDDTPEVRIFEEDTSNESCSVPEDEIRLCAYRKWEDAGKPCGDGLEFWLEAESELS